MTTTLYVCATCRFDASEREHDGRTGGALLLEAIEQQLRELPLDDLRIATTRCLMACNRHCTVHLRAPGKISYVIGDFAPDRAAAATLLDYIAQYRQSDNGQVPYGNWPQGIKGHFIARTPPLDAR